MAAGRIRKFVHWHHRHRAAALAAASGGLAFWTMLGEPSSDENSFHFLKTCRSTCASDKPANRASVVETATLGASVATDAKEKMPLESLSLQGITYYPIKSCGGIHVDSRRVRRLGPLEGDRRFVFVDSNGTFLTQRVKERRQGNKGASRYRSFASIPRVRPTLRLHACAPEENYLAL